LSDFGLRPSRLHQGQRLQRPRKQAGYMTVPRNDQNLLKSIFAKSGPSTHDTSHQPTMVRLHSVRPVPSPKPHRCHHSFTDFRSLSLRKATLDLIEVATFFSGLILLRSEISRQVSRAMFMDFMGRKNEEVSTYTRNRCVFCV
jgi:hypothetical protein